MRHRPALWMAVVGLAVAGGCARKPDDAALVSSVQSQVQADPLLKDAELRVDSNRGEVTLSGTLASDAARLEAFKVASQTPGVVKVNNQISVEVAEAAPEMAPIAPATRNLGPAVTHSTREKQKTESAVVEKDSTRLTPGLRMDGTVPPETKQIPGPEFSSAPVQQAAPVPVAAPPQAPAAPPTPPQPRDVVVPASSRMTVRMIDSIDSSVNRPGEIFHAALQSPMIVDGMIVVPRGTDIYVRLSAAKRAGHLKGKSELHLELLKMEFQGRSYSLYSSTYTVTGTSRGKDTAKRVGGGAAIGAVIGAIAGAGAGAAIGAGIGAGTGAVMSSLTRGKQVKIPSEAMLDFQLEQPVTVTVIPHGLSVSAAQ